MADITVGGAGVGAGKPTVLTFQMLEGFQQALERRDRHKGGEGRGGEDRSDVGSDMRWVLIICCREVGVF